jgi:hypothetical protein
LRRLVSGPDLVVSVARSAGRLDDAAELLDQVVGSLGGGPELVDELLGLAEGAVEAIAALGDVLGLVHGGAQDALGAADHGAEALDGLVELTPGRVRPLQRVDAGGEQCAGAGALDERAGLLAGALDEDTGSSVGDLRSASVSGAPPDQAGDGPEDREESTGGYDDDGGDLGHVTVSSRRVRR